MIKSQSSYTEWCNANEGRAYPLSDSATRVANNGLSLPDDIVVDLGITVPPEYQDVYCTTVRVTPDVFSICLASAASPLLLGTYAASGYTPFTVVALTPLVPDVAGWVVFGGHRRMLNELYVFSGVQQSGIVSRAIRVVDRVPVRRFYKYGQRNGNNGSYLDKIVRITGSGLLSITRDTTNGQQLNVELSKDQAPDFLGPCDHYADAGECRATPVTNINGVKPNSSGAITFRFVPGEV